MGKSEQRCDHINKGGVRMMVGVKRKESVLRRGAGGEEGLGADGGGHGTEVRGAVRRGGGLLA